MVINNLLSGMILQEQETSTSKKCDQPPGPDLWWDVWPVGMAFWS